MSGEVLKGECAACKHVFVVAYLPMELRRVAALAKVAACPKCAGRQIRVASSGDAA